MSEQDLATPLLVREEEAFQQLAERHRFELQIHCYRMLGSIQDAEDLVQETLLRAWRARHSFQGRSSVRGWLYKIATNACIEAIRRRGSRHVATEFGPPTDPAQSDSPRPEVLCLEPYPDNLLDLVDPNAAPDARFDARESVELAFLAALQHLPPRQRAALLLCDVLDWTASETAALLETSIAAVNSGLQRARATLRRRVPRGAESFTSGIASPEVERAVVERYVRAWEAADVQCLAALLKEDVTLSMPPVPSWYLGRSAVTEFLTRNPLSPEWRGRLRLHPTRANRRPTFAVYHRDDERQVFVPFGLMTLRVEGELIVEILGFVDPALFRFFDVPDCLTV